MVVEFHGRRGGFVVGILNAVVVAAVPIGSVLAIIMASPTMDKGRVLQSLVMLVIAYIPLLGLLVANAFYLIRGRPRNGRLPLGIINAIGAGILSIGVLLATALAVARPSGDTGIAALVLLIVPALMVVSFFYLIFRRPPKLPPSASTG
jgi:hypothetical protein